MTYAVIRDVPLYFEWIQSVDAAVMPDLGDPGNRTKPVMVFLHGWGGSSRYWETTAQALAADYHCLLYDLRGFGRSIAIADPGSAQDRLYAMQAYAEDLNQLLDDLGLTQVTLCAHSMGASIATLYAAQYPLRVERLILTCSGVFEYDPLTFKLFHAASRWVVKFRPDWLARIPGMDQVFMARFVNRPIARKDSRAFLADYLVADPTAVLGTIYTSVSQEASQIMPTAFQAVQCPTLLVAGSKDIIIPPQLGQRAAHLNPRIQYVEIPATAHLPMLEDPVAYLKVVREFLGSHKS